MFLTAWIYGPNETRIMDRKSDFQLRNKRQQSFASSPHPGVLTGLIASAMRFPLSGTHPDFDYGMAQTWPTTSALTWD